MTINEIKLELRSMMNGVASAAMRQSDDYRVNFGVEIPRLIAFSKQLLDEVQYDQRPQLSEALWRERVRECRILALMLMPPELMTCNMASAWMNDIKTRELAQYAALYLLRYVADAGILADEWCQSENEVKQECARCVRHWLALGSTTL